MLTESQFFEGSAVGLGIHEVDEAKLEYEPSTVASHVFPSDSSESNGINLGREEATGLTPELLDSDTASSLCEGEELDKVS